MTLLICIHLHAFLLETQRQPEEYLLVVTAESAEDMTLLKVICGNVTFIIMTFNVKKKKTLHFNVKKILQI